MIARSVVGLPAPLRPSNAADSPDFTSRLTPWRMCSLPRWTWTSRRLSMGGLLHEVLVLRPTKIGFANALIVGDRRWIAAGQDRPLREDGDIIGDPKDDVHVVLDDDNVDGARQIADLRHGAAGLRGAHAAGGLVQQKQARLGNQRHPDLEHGDVTIGQGAGRALCESGEADLLERLLDPRPRFLVARGRA